MYKILLIIYRVINNKWILKLPKQPAPDRYFHINDSYRELATLLKQKNVDVDISYCDITQCWLEPNIVTYDRPIIDWSNDEMNDASLILIGNGDVKMEEGKYMKERYNTNIKPWIFWPRRPITLENVLNKIGLKSFEERENESIFIGNFENSVQEKYRKNNNWANVTSEYHCTEGSTYKFSHEEYVIKLSTSKYGLCMRGFGSKCHREVELMSVGTVPIITPFVTIDSYIDSPIENIHYIRINDPSEYTKKISSINKSQWEFMSKSCFEWYQKNIHSNNCWTTMINNILYD